MGNLQLELTYSPGTWQVFERCPREFYLRKIRFWGGWQKGAPLPARRAYVCTKMDSPWTVVGNAVHEVIRQVVLYGKLSREEAVERYKEMVRVAFRESRQREWESDPKGATMLFEHYYGESFANEHAKAQMSKAAPRGRIAIENFFDNEVFGHYRDLSDVEVVSSEDWKTVEPVEGVKSRIRLDLALKGEKDGEPAVELTDWKSGQRRPEHRNEQGIHYAVAATELYEVPIEQVALQFAYLALEGGFLYLETYSQEDVVGYRKRVELRMSELRKRWDLWAEERDDDDPQQWPRQTDKRVCQRCEMFHACWGHKQLDRVRELTEPETEEPDLR